MQPGVTRSPAQQRSRSARAPRRASPSRAKSTSSPGPRFHRANARVRPVKPWPQHKKDPQPFSAGPTDSDDIFSDAESAYWAKVNEISTEDAATTLSSAPEITDRDGASRHSPGSPRGRRRCARIERHQEQDGRSQSCLQSQGKTLLVAVMGLFIVACITADVLDRKWTAAALMNAPMVNGNGLAGSGLQNVSRQHTETVARTLSTAARTTARAPSSPPTPLTSVEGALPRSSSKMATGAGQRGRDGNGTAQSKVTDRCGPVRYTYCQRLRQEFYYDRESATCTDVTSAAAQSAERDLAQHGAGSQGYAEMQLCNISPNRFLTLEACRRTCQNSKSPPKDCLEKTVFLKCRSNKARPALWYFDGHRCHSWNFGDDRCPEGDVFSTHQQCSMTCSSSRIRRNQKRRKPPSCRQPRSLPCPSRERRTYYPFFAHLSPTGDRIRCLQASPSVLVSRRCLVGPNRFSNETECRDSCVRGVASEGADKTSLAERPGGDDEATDSPGETQPPDE